MPHNFLPPKISQFFKSIKIHKNPSPKDLAIYLAIFSLLFFLLTFLFFSKVFQGDWILQQEYVLIYLDSVNLLGLQMPISNISLRFYAVCIFAGFLAGFFLVNYLIKKNTLPNFLLDKILIGTTLFALLGARTFFVLFHLDYFSQDLLAVFDITRGGMSFFGAFLGGFIYLLYYIKKYQYNFWQVADVIIPGVLLGQIIGRFGNFFNYEAYGPETSVFWKMFVPDSAVNVNNYLNSFGNFYHPTFLYEIILNTFLLFVILYNYQKWTTNRVGVVFGFYLMGYGAIRFILENFRLDALTFDLGSRIYLIPDWLVDLAYKMFVQEYVGAYLENLHLEVVLVSQMVAFCFLITGFIIFNRRRKTIFLEEEHKEIRI